MKFSTIKAHPHQFYRKCSLPEDLENEPHRYILDDPNNLSDAAVRALTRHIFDSARNQIKKPDAFRWVGAMGNAALPSLASSGEKAGSSSKAKTTAESKPKPKPKPRNTKKESTVAKASAKSSLTAKGKRATTAAVAATSPKPRTSPKPQTSPKPKKKVQPRKRGAAVPNLDNDSGAEPDHQPPFMTGSHQQNPATSSDTNSPGDDHFAAPGKIGSLDLEFHTVSLNHSRYTDLQPIVEQYHTDYNSVKVCTTPRPF